MSDKPDYTKVNPKVASVIDGVPTPLGIEFHIYKADGSSNGITLPTTEQLSDETKKILGVLANKDARYIYNVISEMTEMVGQLISDTMQSHHAFIHTRTPEGYDEDTLCDGLRQYLSNVNEPAASKVTAENSEKYVLDTFFTGGMKPN